MRRLLTLALVLALAAFAVSAVFAQDATPIALGEWVPGSLTNSEYETIYTFEGTAGDLVLIQMIPAPGTYDLDPSLVLNDSSGDRVAINEDFLYTGALIVAELPDDGTYNVLATRWEGSTGSTEGDYWLRVDAVEPLTSGSKVEATISSDFETATPSVFVLGAESDGPVTVNFSQEIGDLYGSLDIREWTDDSSYGSSIVSLNDTARVSNATITLELESRKFYIVRIDVAIGSFSFNDTTATVTLTVE